MCGGVSFLGVIMEGGWGTGVLYGGEDVPADKCKQWKKKYNPDHYNDNRVESSLSPQPVLTKSITNNRDKLILKSVCHDLLFP